MILCSGAGFPFRTHSIRFVEDVRCNAAKCSGARPNGQRVDLTHLFQGERLAVRTHLTVLMVRPNAIGKAWLFTMRASHDPAAKLTCVGPASSVPGRGC